MNLLLDQNLSSRLSRRLKDAFPGIRHVAEVGLSSASDGEIWEAARQMNGVIVTQDSDFVDLQVLRGFPPKALWLRLGNCTTVYIEAMLRTRSPDIARFIADHEMGLLSLG
jgi:predicted nuclease of predicted toxin-antitoxin system